MWQSVATRFREQWRAQRGFVLFLLCLGVFRTAVADWNPIPSGSMRPNLLEGDVVLVNRLAYSVKLPLTDVVLARTGEPQRGDVVTFSSPRDGVRLIKRVVGLPGDTVAMRDNRIVINGVAASYGPAQAVLEPVEGGVLPATRTLETLPGLAGPAAWPVQQLEGVAARRDFGPVQIPADQYLVLGDNRDNSADSRYIGLVPRDRLIGRAHHVLVSADILGNWLPRFSRFGQSL